VPLDGAPAQGAWARFGDENAFEIEPLSPGRYRVEVTFLCCEHYCKSVRLNGKELPRREFEVQAGAASGEMEIVASDTGRIEANLFDRESRRVYNGVLVIIPAGELNHTKPYYIQGTHNAMSGRRGLAPGQYKLLAFEGISDESEVTPELIARFEPAAKEVVLSEGQSLAVTITAVKP
jgi:hypothetical protein